MPPTPLKLKLLMLLLTFMIGPTCITWLMVMVLFAAGEESVKLTLSPEKNRVGFEGAVEVQLGVCRRSQVLPPAPVQVRLAFCPVTLITMDVELSTSVKVRRLLVAPSSVG